MFVDNLDITDTSIMNYFYPYKDKLKTNICYTPTKLIKHENLERYLNTFNDVVKKDGEVKNTPLKQYEKDILLKFLSDNPVESSESIQIKVLITPTGVEINNFLIHEYTSNNELDADNVYNFITFKNGSFYSIRSQGFRSRLKSIALNSSKKIDREVLKTLIKEVYNSTDKKNWEDTLNNVAFKCIKTTISKILIGLLPNMSMPGITTLSDFIHSETIANSTKIQKDLNIIELKGDLIPFFYNHKNYMFESDGNLGFSCMKHDSNTEQIKFYANNPTNVSLLAYIEDKKLLARGVLWYDVRGKVYIDRIYSAKERYAIKLVAYCKQHNIATIYKTTADDYGMPHSRDCVIKLDTYGMSLNNYPYLDSMCAIDLINGYLSTDISILKNYFLTINEDFLIKNINRNGTYNRSFSEEIHLRKDSNKLNLEYLKNSRGEEIKNGLNNYCLISKPKISLCQKKDTVRVNSNEYISKEYCEYILIKKYNSLKPTLIQNPNNLVEYTIEFYDKKYVVFSEYHKIYIPVKDSIYINELNTYVLTKVYKSESFINTLKLLKLKKMYCGKLVRLTNEGLINLRNQIKLLSHSESLMDIRKSRVYSVNPKNILINGIRIKNIIIPFKHLRFVKNESRKNQK